jgi:hypothetical protein
MFLWWVCALSDSPEVLCNMLRPMPNKITPPATEKAPMLIPKLVSSGLPSQRVDTMIAAIAIAA